MLILAHGDHFGPLAIHVGGETNLGLQARMTCVGGSERDRNRRRPNFASGLKIPVKVDPKLGDNEITEKFRIIAT